MCTFSVVGGAEGGWHVRVGRRRRQRQHVVYEFAFECDRQLLSIESWQGVLTCRCCVWSMKGTCNMEGPVGACTFDHTLLYAQGYSTGVFLGES